MMMEIAIRVFTPVENINRDLQAESATLNGVLYSVETTATELQPMRNFATFEQLFEKSKTTVEEPFL